MSNMKIVSLVAAGDKAVSADVEAYRLEYAQIELEWLRAIREFREKLGQLEVRIVEMEARITSQLSG